MRQTYILALIVLLHITQAQSAMPIDIENLTPSRQLPCELDGVLLSDITGNVVGSDVTYTVLYQSISPDKVASFLVLNRRLEFRFGSFPQCSLDRSLEYLWVESIGGNYELEWRITTTGSGVGEHRCLAVFSKDGNILEKKSKDGEDYSHITYNDGTFCKW